MLIAIRLALVSLALTACGGGLDAPATPVTPTAVAPTVEKLDGSEKYSTTDQILAALRDRGAAEGCDSLEYTQNPTLAVEQGRCMVGNFEYVFQTWKSAPDRDDGTSQLISLLLSADIDFCYVIGRGDGAWSVSISGQDPCEEAFQTLNGELFTSYDIEGAS